MTSPTSRKLDFFLSPKHPCPYLADRDARSLFADPRVKLNRHSYSVLVANGFRRSGEYIYRPACSRCAACVPARVPVTQFHPNRAQRRCLKHNRDLRLQVTPAAFREEHFALYRAYQRARHPGGSMDNPDARDYAAFLWASWSDTLLYEFRDPSDRLLGVAVCDELDNALSAVYTFYDADTGRRSLGTFAILCEIEQCVQRGLEWLYLGYWIDTAPKMAYKRNFRPMEGLTPRGWETVRA